MGFKTSIANFILPKNYYLTRFFYSLATGIRVRGTTPLLVYQMGKVGSSTIVATLKAIPSPLPVFHIHLLAKETIARNEQFYFGDNRGILLPSGWPNTTHLFQSYFFQRQLQTKGQRWKIITLVREPVVRNISGLFESVEYIIPNFYQRLEQGQLSLDELNDCFVHDYKFHDIPLCWFDVELKAALGIDVFATPFPVEKGYALYESAKADVLLLRLESLSDCYDEAFRQFLGLEHVELVNANESRDKGYYETYQRFTKSVKLPASYLDQMYQSTYMRHFYSTAEIARFRAKWEQ